jgi:hypothetical protein
MLIRSKRNETKKHKKSNSNSTSDHNTQPSTNTKKKCRYSH